MSFLMMLEGLGTLLLSLEPVITSGVLVLKETYEYNHTKAALYDFYVAKDVKMGSIETPQILTDLQANDGYYYPIMTENCIESSTIGHIDPIVETTVYAQSVLSEEEESFFNSLVEAPAAQSSHEEDTFFSTLVEAPPEQNMYEEDDYLDLNEFTTSHSLAENLTSQYAANKESIGDFVLGIQEWTVEVIGSEQGYIHVSDGTSRTWLQVNSQDVVNGDILKLQVDRKSHDSILVNSIDLLQRRSLDYALTDILDYVEEYQEAI